MDAPNLFRIPLSCVSIGWIPLIGLPLLAQMRGAYRVEHVRFQGELRRHLLTLSSSQFDPKATSDPIFEGNASRALPQLN
jgi:hypothetical protein